MSGFASSIAPHLGLRPSQVWPVSSESAPFILSFWLIFATSLYLLLRDRTNAAYLAAMEERKTAKMRALQNLIYLEDARLAHAEGGCGEALRGAPVAKFDEPPKAEYVFDLVFEKIEEEDVTRVLDIEPSDPWYLRAMTLLKRRTELELKEATTRTAEAQRLPVGRVCTKEGQLLVDYSDGERLAKVLEFTNEKAMYNYKGHVALPRPVAGDLLDNIDVGTFDRHYGIAGNGSSAKEKKRELCVVDPKVLAAAERTLADVRTAHRNALMYIFDIMRPVFPTYLLGLLFMIVGRAFEAPLWANLLPMFQSSVAKVNPDATEGEFGYGPTLLLQAQSQAFFFLVAFAFWRPCDIVADNLVDKAAKQFMFPLRRAVLRAILRQDTEYFDVNPSATLQERLNRDTDELVEKLLVLPRNVLVELFRVFQRTMTLYLVSPKMMWACLSFNVPMFAIIALSTSEPLRRLLGKRDRGKDKSSADTLELLQNVKTVRQFSMEGKEEDAYALDNVTRGYTEGRILTLESLTHNLRFTGHIVGQLFVVYAALSLAVEGAASTTDAIIVSTVGMWLQHDCKSLLEGVPKLLKVAKPMRHVASLLASKPRIEKDPSANDPGLLRPESFKGSIEFQDVTFSYPTERQKQVLGGLSFTAEPGQKVAFVGKAGCGKSTAMDLLQRFYQPTGGTIKIDGRPIEEYDTNHLRKSCGVVSQVNVMFARSIYENVVYGMENPPGPKSDAFKEVCMQAEAWDFIQSFPNKQYTKIGEDGGVKLSGGQKQRIAIARVIIRQPIFLFLDEATSALDAINEKAVQRSLDDMLGRFNGVALVVAHRLTTICNCDKIVVLGDDGTKVEEGTHAELMRVPKVVDAEGKPVVGPGLYHTLWDTQQMDGGAGEAPAHSPQPASPPAPPGAADDDAPSTGRPGAAHDGEPQRGAATSRTFRIVLSGAEREEKAKLKEQLVEKEQEIARLRLGIQFLSTFSATKNLNQPQTARTPRRCHRRTPSLGSLTTLDIPNDDKLPRSLPVSRSATPISGMAAV